MRQFGNMSHSCQLGTPEEGSGGDGRFRAACAIFFQRLASSYPTGHCCACLCDKRRLHARCREVSLASGASQRALLKYLVTTLGSIFLSDRIPAAGRPKDECDWAIQADRLAKSVVLRTCTFVQLASVHRHGALGRPNSLVSSPSLPSTSVTVLRPTAGKLYELVFDVRGQSVGGQVKAGLTLSSEGTHFKVYAPSVNQHGHDAARFSYLISAERRFSPETVSLVARVLDDRGDPVATGDAPEFQLHLEIQPPRWFLISVFVLFAAGSFLLNWPMPKADGPTDYFWGLLSAEQAFWYCRSAGAALLGLAGYVALNKLPVQL